MCIVDVMGVHNTYMLGRMNGNVVRVMENGTAEAGGQNKMNQEDDDVNQKERCLSTAIDPKYLTYRARTN